MIIFRYLAKETLATTLAVSSVLLMVIMSGRFIKYLAQAASGDIAADVLLQIIAYRIPGFLELVLPLGFFLGILLAYGRLYMDSEMVVLSACGVSPGRLSFYSMIPAAVLAVFIAFLTLYVTPTGASHTEAIFAEQYKRNEFDSLIPGRFMPVSGGGGIVYAQSLSADRTSMHNVFLAQTAVKNDGEGLAVIRAQSATQQVDPVTGQRYLILTNGYQADGTPGDMDYRIVKFDHFAQRMQSPEDNLGKHKKDTLSTEALLASASLTDKATLQWRLSIPVLVLVVALMAAPLAKTNPRQGRFGKFIPSVLIYIIYLVALTAARNAVEDGKLPVNPGLWLVHALFLGLALILLNAEKCQRWWMRRKHAAH